MEKAIKALFILLLILFPLGQIARVELGEGVNVLLNDVLVGIIVLAWFAKKIIRQEPFQKIALTKPILLFFAAAVLSLVVNTVQFSLIEVLISALYLVRWVCYAGLYFVVADFERIFRQKIMLGLLLSATAAALVGFLQYFFYPNLRNLFYLGWDEHLYRLFSSFLDPNFAGGIFVLGFLLAVSLFHQQKRVLFGVSALFLGVATLLTYSRGSFLSFAVGTVALLILMKQKKIALFFILVFIIGVYFLPKNLGGEGVNLLRSASIEARFESSKEALVIFQQYPVFGAGFNAYRYAREKLGLATINEYGDIHSAAGTDNSFLFVLATTGIVGFGSYMYMWFVIGKVYRKNPLVTATIAAIFVHTLFVNSLFYPQIMEWLWILFGLSQKAKVQKSP